MIPLPRCAVLWIRCVPWASCPLATWKGTGPDGRKGHVSHPFASFSYPEASAGQAVQLWKSEGLGLSFDIPSPGQEMGISQCRWQRLWGLSELACAARTGLAQPKCPVSAGYSHLQVSCPFLCLHLLSLRCGGRWRGARRSL